MKNFRHLLFFVFLPWVLMSGLKYAAFFAFGLIYLNSYFELMDFFTWVCFGLGLVGILRVFEPIEAWVTKRELAARSRQKR